MARWTPEELIEQLLQNRLDDEVLIRSAEDPELGRHLDRLREMVEGLSALRGAEPPAELVRSAKGLMPRGGWARKAMAAVRAALALDTVSPAMATVRSQTAAPAAERYLRFEASDHTAELHVLPAGAGRFDVEGRLLEPEGQAPFAVIAHSPGGKSIPALSDGNGRFRFPDLPAGQYELHLELDDLDLFLAPLVLSGPEAEEPGTAS
jgi:hypothetical protein